MAKFIKLPIFLVAVFVVMMIVVDLILTGYAIPTPVNTVTSFFVFVVGLLIIASGGYSFRKANTTISPLAPGSSSQLVTGGVYNYSRNPMYVGFFLWLLACVMLIGNIINLLLLPLFVLLVNKLYIIPEERALEALFAEEYVAYKSRVRRWV